MPLVPQSRNLHNQQHQAPTPVVEQFNLEEPIENPRTLRLRWLIPRPKFEFTSNKPLYSKVEFEHIPPQISPVAELKDMVKALLLDKKNQSPAPTPVKAVVQPPAYQAPAYQAPAPQIQGVSKEDFQAYVKANDAVMEEHATLKAKQQNQLPNLSFEISFTDALMLMPKFASTLKTLIGNKEKLSEMARTPLNENCSACNPTPYYESNRSLPPLLPLTPYGDMIFILFKEADSFLAIEDDPTSPEVDPIYYDPDGDILLFEAILNSDPSPPPPNQGNYFPKTRKDLKICKANSSVNEPPEVELKDLPPHLEYAFLEGDDKLPVIMQKI
ncbi:hypothetical protein Tco_1575829 [Tanacetum coccineum]